MADFADSAAEPKIKTKETYGFGFELHVSATRIQVESIIHDNTA